MMVEAPGSTERIRISLADERHRERIYEMRHDVYATELGQHAENPDGLIVDELDEFNTYIVASLGDEVIGFVSITPPGGTGYSLDKYVSRDELPFPCDDGLFEGRILTIKKGHRGGPAAGLLMHAVHRWIVDKGGTRLIMMGRREILGLYTRVGVKPLGRRIRSGAVTFELMSATMSELEQHAAQYSGIRDRLRDRADWQLGIPFDHADSCYHGGAFFDAIGPTFDDLERRHDIINADVLDAWFPPSPRAIEALRSNLPWLARTSPPTDCSGMVERIADLRGVPPGCIVPGAGSSDLIFLAFQRWLNQHSRVLILDPMYGEYAHVLDRVVGCGSDSLTLRPSTGFALDPADLALCLQKEYDMVVLVNPNSPTGQHVPASQLEMVLNDAPPNTRFWIDEAYVDYVGSDQSLERYATRSRNVVVCKTMSKVYALSGMRAAYLCGPAPIIEDVRQVTPPWCVGLPAQLAAARAVEDTGYYAAVWRTTHLLRAELATGLEAIGLEVIPSVANFLLCWLPPGAPDASEVVDACRDQGLYLRDPSSMGTRFGARAVRIAVKDAATNLRMLDILGDVLRQAQRDANQPGEQIAAAGLRTMP